MKRFFYFRDEVAAGDDDDAQASILVPIDDITGMNAQAATKLDIYFSSQANIQPGADGEVVVSDSVRLTVTTETQKGVMKALVQAMNSGPHHEGITIVADDQLGKYLVPEITACDITVAATVV
jgi:hypothetical protein